MNGTAEDCRGPVILRTEASGGTPATGRAVANPPVRPVPGRTPATGA
ncbi:hypothetical protein ACE1OA_18555 [Streptomyces sp. JL2001]